MGGIYRRIGKSQNEFRERSDVVDVTASRTEIASAKGTCGCHTGGNEPAQIGQRWATQIYLAQIGFDTRSLAAFSGRRTFRLKRTPCSVTRVLIPALPHASERKRNKKFNLVWRGPRRDAELAGVFSPARIPQHRTDRHNLVFYLYAPSGGETKRRRIVAI